MKTMPSISIHLFDFRANLPSVTFKLFVSLQFNMAVVARNPNVNTKYISEMSKYKTFTQTECKHPRTPSQINVFFFILIWKYEIWRLRTQLLMGHRPLWFATRWEREPLGKHCTSLHTVLLNSASVMLKRRLIEVDFYCTQRRCQVWLSMVCPTKIGYEMCPQPYI